MSTETVGIPVIARLIWESNQPLSAVADRVDVAKRYLQLLLAKGKLGEVGVDLANQVTSFAVVFTLPFTPDQSPVVRFSRRCILRATTLSEIRELLEQLDIELSSSRASQAIELEAMMHWQMNYALHRGAGFTEGYERRRLLCDALLHAELMMQLLPRTSFADPSLMRTVALRNYASSSFLAANAVGKAPSPAELRTYIGAYDDAEKEVAKSLPNFKGAPERKKAHLPMLRALALDRVEMAAHLGDTAVIEESIARLRRVGASTSGHTYQLALESIDKTARNVLWRNKAWIELNDEINGQVAKYDKQDKQEN